MKKIAATTDPAIFAEILDALKTAPTAPTPTDRPTPPAFWRDPESEFRPRKGFETVLFNHLLTLATEDELVRHMMDSGDFARVAPRAAELRPTKPTRFLLKTWTAAGIVKRTK